MTFKAEEIPSGQDMVRIDTGNTDVDIVLGMLEDSRVSAFQRYFHTIADDLVYYAL